MNEKATKYKVSRAYQPHLNSSWGDQQQNKKKIDNPTESVQNLTSFANISCCWMNTNKFSQHLCVTRATMQKKIRNCCTNTNRVTARYNRSRVTSSIITTRNGSRLKITRIFVCKWKYLGVTFAKTIIGIKIIEKHKTRKNQQNCKKLTFTIKITL